jgi:aminopeptidase N
MKRYTCLDNKEIGQVFGGLHYSAVSKDAKTLPFFLGLILVLAITVEVFGASDAILHHDLQAVLDPSAHRIEIKDRLHLPPSILKDAEEGICFVLHSGLHVNPADPAYMLEALPGEPDWKRYGINKEDPQGRQVPLREYRLRPASGSWPEVACPLLAYHGEICHLPVAEREYAGSFPRSPGIINEKGVVLSGTSCWLPTFGEDLLTFVLTVELPKEWDCVSQGERTRHETIDGQRRVTWDSPDPAEEVHLIAGPFTEYSRRAGNVTICAFLRDADLNLAVKYLETAIQYLDMYQKLIGPYPYRKFALVENFWETGYGMPSFTLLGPKIIRFPFILHSSYPHEILHNWWGNSVFVDPDRGNWCEGLTTYVANHLIKEGQGHGSEYRRDTLQKYRDYATRRRDFPLKGFRSRHSPSTAAVGYGKAMMLCHMLRRRLGDGVFVQGLRRFYQENRFGFASFADLERAFSAVSKQDLGPFFRQWVERTGAPQLELGEVMIRQEGPEAVLLTVELRQVQKGDPYSLAVPVAVTLEGEPQAKLNTLNLVDARGIFNIKLAAAPRRLDVDPEFDLFRRLDPSEVPPSIGQLLGAEGITVILPETTDDLGAGWLAFAQSWTQGESEQIRIVKEGEIKALPADRAVWILGSDNLWSSHLLTALASCGAGLNDDSVHFGQIEVPRKDHCFVFTVQHPDAPNLAIGWVGADRASALPGLASKLPHYGKYSFLAFSGDEPSSVAKGQWPTLNCSPLVRIFGPEAIPVGSLPTREPLARLEEASYHNLKRTRSF